jgi:hypothetical protein
MVDVLLSNENLSIFGGPASLDINVDYGAPGIRGSLIFTGPGKPTDAAVTFSTPPLPQDLYINLLPSDFEYLFLYQYNSVNGVLGWSKVLRLIPNTALANIPVVFIDGIARTVQPTAAALAYIAAIPPTVPPQTAADIFEGILAVTVTTEPTSPTPGMFWLDFTELPSPILKFYNGLAWVDFATILDKLYFPISDFFSQEEIAVGATSGFNVQYVILNDSPIASGLTIEPLTTIGSKIYLPVSITATETIPFSPGSLLTWQKINGVKTLSFVLVANIGTLPLF